MLASRCSGLTASDNPAALLTGLGLAAATNLVSRGTLAWQLTRDFVYDPNFETTVEVTFEETAEGTRVQFEHRDLERMGADAVETFEGMDGGWGMLLDLFKTRAEQS